MRTAFFKMAPTLLAVLLFCASCMEIPQPGQTEGGLVIGVNLPLSGEFAEFGKSALEGVRLKVSEANQAGGVNGAPVRLVVFDNHSSQLDAVEAYFKLAQNENASAVIGPYSTECILSVKSQLSGQKVPVLAPGATNDQIVGDNPYLFRTCFNDTAQGAALAEHARRKARLSTVAILVNTDVDADYSRGLAKAFRKKFEELGGRVVMEEGYTGDNLNFKPFLSRASFMKCDAVFAPSYPAHAVEILRQAAQARFKGVIFGGDGWDSPVLLDQGGMYLKNGFFHSRFFNPENKNSAAADFVSMFQAAFGREPNGAAAQGYDTAGLLIDAAARAGVSPENITRGLRETADYEGATGKTSMLPDGNAEKEVFVNRFQNNGIGKARSRIPASTNPKN